MAQSEASHHHQKVPLHRGGPPDIWTRRVKGGGGGGGGGGARPERPKKPRLGDGGGAAGGAPSTSISSQPSMGGEGGAGERGGGGLANAPLSLPHTCSSPIASAAGESSALLTRSICRYLPMAPTASVRLRSKRE